MQYPNTHNSVFCGLCLLFLSILFTIVVFFRQHCKYRLCLCSFSTKSALCSFQKFARNSLRREILSPGNSSANYTPIIENPANSGSLFKAPNSGSKVSQKHMPNERQAKQPPSYILWVLGVCLTCENVYPIYVCRHYYKRYRARNISEILSENFRSFL